MEDVSPDGQEHRWRDCVVLVDWPRSSGAKLPAAPARDSEYDIVERSEHPPVYPCRLPPVIANGVDRESDVDVLVLAEDRSRFEEPHVVEDVHVTFRVASDVTFEDDR